MTITKQRVLGRAAPAARSKSAARPKRAAATASADTTRAPRGTKPIVEGIVALLAGVPVKSRKDVFKAAIPLVRAEVSASAKAGATAPKAPKARAAKASSIRRKAKSRSNGTEAPTEQMHAAE